MKTIYKYNVLKLENGILEAPIERILHADVQKGEIYVWAEVDTDKPNRKFQILPLGTGWNLDGHNSHKSVLETHKYLNTVLIGDALVFHIYYAPVVTVSTKETSKPTLEETLKANYDEATNRNSQKIKNKKPMINLDLVREFN